jgi:hypothetical protein
MYETTVQFTGFLNIEGEIVEVLILSIPLYGLSEYFLTVCTPKLGKSLLVLYCSSISVKIG